MIALGTEAQNQAFFCFLVAVVFLAGSLIFYFDFYHAEKCGNKDVEEKFRKLDETTEETEFIDQKKPCIESERSDGPHPPPTKVVIPHKGQLVVNFQTCQF